MSDSLRSHGLQHARLPCPPLSPRVCPSSWPLNQWCHPTISSPVAFFSYGLYQYTKKSPRYCMARGTQLNVTWRAGREGSLGENGYTYWRRKLQPTPVFLSGKSHGQRSLAGYSPWRCRVRQDLATEQQGCMYMCGWVPLPTTWTNTSLIGYTPIQNKKFKNKRTKIRFPGFSKKKKKSLRRNYVRFLNIQLFSHPWVNHIDENVWQKHALMERVSRQVREAHKQISLIIRRAAADLLMRSV